MNTQNSHVFQPSLSQMAQVNSPTFQSRLICEIPLPPPHLSSMGSVCSIRRGKTFCLEVYYPQPPVNIYHNVEPRWSMPSVLKFTISLQ